MNYLGHPQAAWEAAGGIWTAREISQQPVVWAKIEAAMRAVAGETQAFLAPLLGRRELRLVLTGAGTSSFIGECLMAFLKRTTGLRVDAVATTDLVGAPASCLDADVPTLLVSFARSGNSPESLAAVVVAEQAVRDCHHLIVTCNPEGELYRKGKQLPNAHVILLPEETNDRGFAMTSSFSGMLLATSLAFLLLGKERTETLSVLATHILEARMPYIADLAHAGFERVVYLGGDGFKGLAREAALKLLELSDGKVVALAETPLGFRHGPKTIVNGKTLVVMFLSNDPHARRYEMDLLRELRSDGVAGRVVALSANVGSGAQDSQRDWITVPASADTSNLALCFPYVVFAQSLAILQSLALGNRPDTPNARGVVNRVVQGVTIYPWNPREPV
jgi:tagatose-6-phosphate ketose/aldose isomerase